LFRSDIPIQINPDTFGVYSTAACTDYIPHSDRTFINSGSGADAYIKPANWASDITAVTLQGSAQIQTSGPDVNGVYTVSVPASFAGTETVRIEIEFKNGDHYESENVELVFTDGSYLTIHQGSQQLHSLSETPVGGRGFTKVTYGPDNIELPSDTVFTLRSDDNKETLGEFLYDSDRGMWSWNLDGAYPNQSGILSVTVGGKTYTCPVELGEPDVLVYSDSTYTTYVPRNAISASYSKGETSPVFYLVAGNGGEITGTPTGPSGIQFAEIGSTGVYKMTVDTNMMGQISGEVRIPFESPNSGGYYNIYPNFRGVIQKEEAVKPEDVILNPVASATDAVPFTLDGETYYMSVRLGTLPFPISGDGQDPDMEEGQYDDVVFSIAFYTSPNNGGSDSVAAEYELVQDEQTLNKIRQAFGDTLSLTVAPARFVLDDGMTVAAPQYYPETIPCTWPELNAWQQPISMRRGLKQHGTWVLTASGTVKNNGTETTVTHTALSRWHPVPAKFLSFDSVTELNNWLNTCTIDNETRYYLTLAAGVHRGQIIVPERIGTMSVVIRGAYDERYSDGGDDTQYDAYRTILLGGVHAKNSFSAYVSDLHMIGAGKNAKKWGSHNDNGVVAANGKDTDNFALTGIFVIGNCIIEEYYHAVDCSGEGNQYTASFDSVFLHNGTALCYNNDAANTVAPNGIIQKNIFYENEIAVHFEKIWDQQAMTHFFFNKNNFISNKIDVQNDETLDEGKTRHKYSYSDHRWAYLPNNYFGDGNVYNGYVMPGWQTRLCKANHHGSHRLDSPVATYPQQMQPNRGVQMFRMTRGAVSNPYEIETEPVLNNNTASSYPFPAETLPGKIITLMGSEDGCDIVLARLDFTGSAAGAAGEFDPQVTLSRNKTDTEITLTVNDPLGLAPVVCIPCDESWTAAEVICSSGTLEATVADGYVSFTAEQGGTYIIRPKAQSSGSGVPGSLLAGAAGGTSVSFADVAAGAWYYNDVAWACNEGLMNGTGFGKFSPDTATSRAMIVTILWRLEGCPMDMEVSSFSDTDRNSWYGYAVDWAAAFGIVEGANGRFMPNDPITREQLAAILYRYAAYKGYDTHTVQTGLNSFADVGKVSAYAAGPMQWAVGAGLINGVDGNLLPQGQATRAQTAAILHRFFG